MAFFYVRYDPDITVRAIFDDLEACGLLGEFFVPCYLDPGDAPCLDRALETINDTFYLSIPLEYTPGERYAHQGFADLFKRSGIAVPEELAKFSTVYRGDELVRGEEFIPELGLTVSRMPDIRQQARQHLAEAQQKRTVLSATLHGNVCVTYEAEGSRRVGHFCRQVFTGMSWSRELTRFSLAIERTQRIRYAGVSIDFDMGAWLGNREGTKPFVPPFSHECRKVNWKRFMTHLRRLAEQPGLKKRFEARLREYKMELKGLGVAREFRSLPAQTRIIG